MRVTINIRLSWKPRIFKVHSKASPTLGLGPHGLGHSMQLLHRPRRQHARLLVRPTLEYATCAWSPYTKVDTQTIERIQQVAARFISGDFHRNSSITAMLNRLEWNIPLPPIIMAVDNWARWAHHHNLWLIPSACLVYQNTFYMRCVPVWNHLPHKTVYKQKLQCNHSRWPV